MVNGGKQRGAIGDLNRAKLPPVEHNYDPYAKEHYVSSEHGNTTAMQRGRDIQIVDTQTAKNAAGGGEGETGLGQRVLHLVRKRDAGLAACRIVDDDRVLARLLRMIGVVPLIGRADLADRGGAQTLVAGHLQDGLFVEIVALEMLVDVAEHGVVLDEGDHSVTGGHRGVVGPDRVGEHAGVAEIMAGRHRRAVGHGEGREQRMRVLEVDALVADLGHGRCGLGSDLQRAQPVGDEQDQVAGRVVLGECRSSGKSGGQHCQPGGQQHQ